MNVLFICVGNVCRSPMAEALFNLESRRMGSRDVAASAGVLPYSGVVDEPIKVLKEVGVEAVPQAPKPLTPEMIKWADLIIILDKAIIGDLAGFQMGPKTRVEVWDVEDPFGGTIHKYRRVRDHLHERIRHLLGVSHR